MLGSHHGIISLGCFRNHPKLALICDANDGESAPAGGLVSPEADGGCLSAEAAERFLLRRSVRLLAVSDSVDVEESVGVEARILRADEVRDGM